MPEAADDPEESIDSGQTWFVQYRDAEKKTIVKKMSTARVLKLLKAGKLSAKARAKVTATGYYLPLAEFAEFTEAIEQTLQRKNPADVRHDDLKNVYKKARREQKQETPGRSVKDRPHGMMGNGVGIACLLAIGLLLWLGAMYGRVMFEYLGQVVTDMMN